MTDLAGNVSELADLWPALARALARDSGGEGGAAGHTWAAVAVVNADVLAAMLTLGREIPETVRYACEAVSEPWQYRDLDACLRQVPRLAGRMHDLRMARDERTLGRLASGWLRTVKRALGLRRPDLAIGYDCPYAASMPEQHPYPDERGLFWAGDEGFLRTRDGALQVEWVHSPVIYCASPDHDASWGKDSWSYLGLLLGTPAMAEGVPTP